MLYRTCRVQFGPHCLKFRQRVREFFDEISIVLNSKQKYFQRELQHKMFLWPRKPSFEKTAEINSPELGGFSAPSTESFEKWKNFVGEVISRIDTLGIWIANLTTMTKVSAENPEKFRTISNFILTFLSTKTFSSGYCWSGTTSTKISSGSPEKNR